MKKIIVSIVAFLTLIMFLPTVSAETSKVPVYMFTKDGCSACLSAKEYFENLAAEEPDLFELIEIEVFDYEWNAVSKDLQKLLIAVYEEFGEDTSRASTPTIVIGDYHTVGFPQDDSLVEEAIRTASESETKVDKVSELMEELNITLEPQEENKTEDTNKYDTIIIIGIFVVLIGGIAGLVIAGKK